MNKENAIQQLLQAAKYFENQSEGYRSWGKVQVLQIAIRLENNDILITDKDIELHKLTVDNIAIDQQNQVFKSIFKARKKVNIILITHQEFASQIKDEIPPILDDQAQLLGVTVRVAKNENGILSALSNRFAAILPDGDSICLGNSLEDAYVAAQLLEKTAKSFVMAKHLGGAKSINKIEADRKSVV